MTRFRIAHILVAGLMASLSSPLEAQDDFRTVLQEHQLRISFADLISNDTTSQVIVESIEPLVVLGPGPSGGVLSTSEDVVSPSDDYFVYQPNEQFFGIDSFRYRWNSPWGPIEADVEIFVTPWIIPLAGPMGLLVEDPDVQSVGYYNSYSGIFYLCDPTQTLSSTQELCCTPYRYPDVEPGWLPLMGTWLTAKGHVLNDRPSLYDPVARRIVLLDKGPTLGYPMCLVGVPPLPLIVVDEFELDGADSSAVIPIAMDLDGNGFDSIISFRSSTGRFDHEPTWATFWSDSGESTLWPLAVPNLSGPDDAAAFGQQSGQLQFLSKAGGVGLWSSPASLATVRRVGPHLKYEVYNAEAHRLQDSETVGQCIGGVWVDGTHIVRFPSDPDPPPSGGGGQTNPVPCQ